ncbi:MAG: tRNA (adenosine(37)-N6)-threonylcarbamoyltransferase complex ATPase subunit type 1 TsaE [Zetaproteobacteria bacterium]|nr:tRNA (adenosine(37)-N6)-threonylcarbamoyltransferase complex ATPase subunit type 1 TsaE [Zetaproteobacteria bacterium]
MPSFFLANEEETRKFAAQFSKTLQAGDTVALYGDLGAGKSFFARALMRTLGVTDHAMPSPTFTLIQTYEGQGCQVAHMDWYRLSSHEEVEMLGVQDYFIAPWIALIEWPTRAASLLPKETIHVTLTAVDNDMGARTLTIDQVSVN